MDLVLNHDGLPIRVENNEKTVVQIMSCEDRDSILSSIENILNERMSKWLSDDLINSIWDNNEMLDKLEIVFEPYVTGWRNYN